MSEITTTTETTSREGVSSPINQLMDRCEHILHQHRAENPDLYRIIPLKKKKRGGPQLVKSCL